MNHRKRPISMAFQAVFAATVVLLLWGARGLLPAAWANGGGGGTSYVLTLEIHGSGTVHLDPPDETYSDDTSKAYAKDKQVTLTATPASGWYFSHWEGDVGGSGHTRTITMSSNKMAVAIFKQPTLTVHKQGMGQVQVYVQGYPPGETLTPTFSRAYPVNTSVVLIAHPPTGWAFVKWTGDASGASPSKIIGLSADKTVTAVFEPIKLTVSMEEEGAGSVNVTPPNQTDDEPFTVTFAGAINSQQTVATAYPNVGWAFKEWTGDHSSTENPTTIHVDGEEEVTAVFEEVELTVDTEGKGVVHIDPPDVTPEEEEYPHTEKYAAADPQDPPTVDLAASPTDANWGFKEWTGDVESPADTAEIEVVMDAAKSVTAIFDQVEVTITIEGNGGVSTAPTGEVISETKKGFAYGAEVAFTATPDPGWAFKEWTGAITGAEPTASPEDPLTSNISVMAVFEQVGLSLEREGEGKVRVVSTGQNELVTPPWSTTYPGPREVTLTALPDANWGFKEWSGDLAGDSSSDTLTVDRANAVTAVFEQAVLTSNTEGEGTVSRNPGGAFIAANKSGHAPGDLVEVEATPAANWGFKEWTGAINTTDNPAEVEMDGDQSVTAVFYQVELTVTKTGEGEVTTTPYGNTEEPTFTEWYAPGQTVSLEPVAVEGWRFDHWAGDDVPTGSEEEDPLELSMGVTDRSVEAVFVEDTVTLTMQPPFGNGTVTPSTGSHVHMRYDEVTLTATPAPHWTFVSWSGDFSSSANPATFELTDDMTVRAQFEPLTVTLSAENGLTECMEGRVVTYTATASSNFPVSSSNQATFTFYFRNAGGTYWSQSVTSSQRTAIAFAEASNVPSGDANHMFSTPIMVDVVSGDGTAQASSTNLWIDVYELWIEYFRDAATGSDWKVVVGENIAFSAIASSDCNNWAWDMPEGVPDRWNPTGGNSKGGAGMVIPTSDMPEAEDWDHFGPAYGEVTVSCTDGDGNNHSFSSHDMSPSNDVSVYFDPGGTVHPPDDQSGTYSFRGHFPSKNWFYYWRAALFPTQTQLYYKDIEFGAFHHDPTYGTIVVGDRGNSNFAIPYDHNAMLLALGFTQSQIDSAGAGGQRVTADGKSGIDLFYCITSHELQHGVDHLTRKVDPPLDLPDMDSFDNQYDPAPNAINGTGLLEHTVVDPWKGDFEYSARQVEGVTAASSKDWSKGGKNW